jgi:phospholipase C
MNSEQRLSRRGFLGGVAAGMAGLAFDACARGDPSTAGRSVGSILPAGARPYPKVAEGTDMIPKIEHIVVLMLENHSFDNFLGMLGRGDGFKLGSHGRPTASNPYRGKTLHAFHMPTPCQLASQPTNSWNAAHLAYDHGTCRGFANGASGPASMGYFDETDLPFTYSLAKTFPINDRYFCSVMAETYPNRRFLISGTALGIVKDTATKTVPPNGVIFQALSRHGISWRDYYSDLPTLGVYIDLLEEPSLAENVVGIDQFFTDARDGTLPGFCIVDPNFVTESQENPQDIQYGEVFFAEVVNALMGSPSWPGTLFVWTYDEHGGYFDHVPPPSAAVPDGIRPDIKVPPDQPGGYDRYGFRVPAGVVSPYAKPNYVSHVVSDHTSILKLVETKWNLPALTRRDANASNLLDMVDLEATPAFLEPPTLAKAADPSLRAQCLTTGAGVIPPPGALGN